MKKDGKTIIRYRPMSMYVEDYLPKQKEIKNRKRGKRKCDHCNNKENEDYGCNHTSDVRHAKNFELYGDVFVEK